MAVVDVEELAKKQGLKPNLQLFAEETEELIHMVGEKGTQVISKTVWKNGKIERLDVENPLPGKRPGQIHYHDANNIKFYYNIKDKLFYDQKTNKLAPKSIQNLLKDRNFTKEIDKALKILGE